MGKFMGIDYGRKRIGVALSDEEKRFAFPHSIIENTSKSLQTIQKLVEEHMIERIILGESLNAKNRDNVIMEKIRVFASLLNQTTNIPVYFEPEQYTSAQARRMFENKEKTRKPETSKAIDSSAAALILQAYIDKHR